VEKPGEPKLVNTWKPVTSEWRETEAPPVQPIATPEVERQIANVAVCRHSSRDAGLPFLIVVYAGYCFLRTVIMLLAFYMVVYEQDSSATRMIYAVTIPTVERLSYPAPVVERFQNPESHHSQFLSGFRPPLCSLRCLLAHAQPECPLVHNVQRRMLCRLRHHQLV